MKREKKTTRAHKEELSKISRASRNVANSVDYDRKGAIIDEAFRQLEEKKNEQVQVQREKIKLPLADFESSEDATGVSTTRPGPIIVGELVEAMNSRVFDKSLDAISKAIDANSEIARQVARATWPTKVNIEYPHVDHFLMNQEEKANFNYCTVDQFEKDIMLIEDIQIYVRAVTNATIRKYNHRKPYGNTNTVMSFMKRLVRETSLQYTFEIPGWDKSDNMTMESLKNIQSIFVQEKQPIS